MGKVPVKFVYEGKEYTGYLSPVSGGGNPSQFHLMIDNYYRGSLFYTQAWEWRFGSQDGRFENLVHYFSSAVIMWYECNSMDS